MNTSIHETENLLFITLLQLIVMIGVARYMHNVFRRMGQPGVIGEIFAGLLLGPSLFGHLFPQLSLALFGAHASTPISIISQIGLIFLMFQIGMDFQFGHLATRRNRRAVMLQLGGLVGLVALLWFVLRPFVAHLLSRLPSRNGDLNPNLMAIVVCLIFALGICTYRLGIFAIFGGFAGGVLFHQYSGFVEAWRRQVGRFVLVFFLPVFFTYTGLRTNVLGLSSIADWQWLAIILGAAILGKVIPVYFMGRACGFDRSQSSILGVLMNTRALMELIVINIGFDLGLIPQKVFTMLVIMAVVTTLMTGPLLKLLLHKAGHPIPVGVEA